MSEVGRAGTTVRASGGASAGPRDLKLTNACGTGRMEAPGGQECRYFQAKYIPIPSLQRSALTSQTILGWMQAWAGMQCVCGSGYSVAAARAHGPKAQITIPVQKRLKQFRVLPATDHSLSDGDAIRLHCLRSASSFRASSRLDHWAGSGLAAA